jgi:hypothetical protein
MDICVMPSMCEETNREQRAFMTRHRRANADESYVYMFDQIKYAFNCQKCFLYVCLCVRVCLSVCPSVCQSAHPLLSA